MSHQVETMAFANEVPWHGLGKVVDPLVSIEEMTHAAGLDWRVQPHPVFARVNGDETPLSLMAFVRDTDNRILTVASDRWKPLQNWEAMEFFRDYTREGGATLETAGSLRGGRIVWGLASLGKGYSVGSDDVVQGYLLMIVPHEVGKSIQIRVTSVRVVCANTMAMALGEGMAHFRQSHVNLFQVDKAKEATNIAIAQFMGGEATAKKLLSLKLTDRDTIDVLKPHFQPTMGEDDDPGIRLSQVIHSVKFAPGAIPNTGWGVLNGVIHWCDHVTGRNRDTRLTKSWLGKTGRIKEKVRSKLLQMSE